MPKNKPAWRRPYQPPSLRDRLGNVDTHSDVRMNDGQSKLDYNSKDNNQMRRNVLNSRDEYSIRRQNSNSFKKYHKNNQKPNNSIDNETWFKITVPHGNKVGKPYIFSSIQQRLSHPLNPSCAHVEGNAFIFWVDSYDLSRQLSNLSMKITTPNGFKLKIISTKDKAPNPPELDEEHAEKLKHAMSLRYNNVLKVLNMSDFANDAGLKSQALHLPLFRNNVIKEVVKVIEQHIPDVESIDFSLNKISYLYTLSFLRLKAKNLKNLSLANNQLKSESELYKLQDLPLQRLNLSGNPLVKYFDDKDAYISAVRKIFPNLEVLDDVELPKVIKFDVENALALPNTKPSFYINEEIKDVVQRFLQQYYALYDSQDRSELAAAYHENAYFSMSCGHTSAAFTNRKHADLRMYIGESRNLLKVSDKERRNKQIHIGAAKIASFLNTLPDSQHDYSSFVVDIVTFTQTILVFTVTGVLKDKNKSENFEFIRYFSRTFYAIPVGAGIRLINDMLNIVPPSGDILKNAFKSPQDIASTSSEPPQITHHVQPQHHPSPQIPSLLGSDRPHITPTLSQMPYQHSYPYNPVSSSILPQPPTHTQMIQTLCQRTGMNPLWSEKCLIDSQWDYQVALDNFTTCHSDGVLPPEAFAPISH